MERLKIPRVSLDTPGFCSHANVVAGAKAFGIHHFCQDDIHQYVSDPDWGTEPDEMVEMGLHFLPETHVMARQNWSFKQIEKLLNEARMVVILDITDDLQRVSNITHRLVNNVDGHYVILSGIRDIKGIKYGKIIDPSQEEIVKPGACGAILTEEENVYWLPLDLLDGIWNDENKDGSLNDHWALVMLHPEDDPSILEKYRNQGKIS